MMINTSLWLLRRSPHRDHLLRVPPPYSDLQLQSTQLRRGGPNHLVSEDAGLYLYDVSWKNGQCASDSAFLSCGLPRKMGGIRPTNTRSIDVRLKSWS